MSHDEKPSNKPASPFVRWVIVPVAFSWVGAMLTAPLAIWNASLVAAGLLSGMLIGFVVSWRNPSWVDRAVQKDVSPLRNKPVTRTEQVFLTLLATAMTGIVAWSTISEVKREGIAFFLAMFLMISFARKSLRRAWGEPGSLVGMIVCGCLLFLLVRCSLPEAKTDPTMAVLITVPLMIIEAFDEFRYLSRRPR